MHRKRPMQRTVQPACGVKNTKKLLQRQTKSRTKLGVPLPNAHTRTPILTKLGYRVASQTPQRDSYN